MFAPTPKKSSQNKEETIAKMSSSSSGAAEGKSSYYVMYLGSRESKGLRGAEYVRPVARRLLDRAAADGGASSTKLTLQVTHFQMISIKKLRFFKKTAVDTCFKKPVSCS